MPRTPLVRRHVALVIMLALAGALLASALAQSTRPQIFTAATRTSLGPFDPIRSTTSTNGWFLMNIFENLVWSDGEGNYSPRLATNWELESETVWRFDLRQGVTFHDGTPFNAEAVKFSLERIASDASVHFGDFSWLSDVEIIDDYTIRIHTDGPYPPLLARMSFYYPFIVSPTAVATYGDDFVNNPIGTGPFRLLEHVNLERSVLVRNDDYWGEAPTLERVNIVQVTEENARLTGMLTGELDASLVVEPAMKGFLEQRGDYQVITGPGTLVDRWAFNVEVAPFDDVRVRQAITHAIDRELLLEAVFDGLGTIFDGGAAGSLIAASPEISAVRFDYDPERARALLAEAGVAPGTRIGIWAASRPDHRQIVEVLERDLAAVGLVLDITLMEASTLTSEIRRGVHPSYMFGSYAVGDVDRVLTEFESANIPVGNRFMYRNDEVDALIAQQRVELDPVRRSALVAEVQELLVQEALQVPFRARVEVQALQPYVSGWEYHPEAWIFWTVSLD